jgi:hypothetical protein
MQFAIYIFIQSNFKMGTISGNFVSIIYCYIFCNNPSFINDVVLVLIGNINLLRSLISCT